jgi:hypothetical protein
MIVDKIEIKEMCKLNKILPVEYGQTVIKENINVKELDGKIVFTLTGEEYLRFDDTENDEWFVLFEISKKEENYKFCSKGKMTFNYTLGGYITTIEAYD